MIYLHKNKSLLEFIEDTKLNEETVNKMIAFLKDKNWLAERNGKLKPSVCIITTEDSENLYR